MAIRTFADKTPVVADTAYIDPAALVQGDVTIGEHSSVWPMTSIRGDVHHIRIGARSNIQDNCTLHVTHAGQYNPNGRNLIVGDDVTVGHQVLLHACTIANHCLIGMGSLILDDAIVEDNTMLGAGSLVPGGKVLTSGYLWLGRPAKRIRTLTDAELEFLHYSAQSYVKLKDQTRLQNSRGNEGSRSLPN